MGYFVSKFQNVSAYSDEAPTVSIEKGEPLWEEAYENWCNGKPPTNSPEWKKGVIAVSEIKEVKEVKKSFWQKIKDVWHETGESMRARREQQKAYDERVRQNWERYHNMRKR